MRRVQKLIGVNDAKPASASLSTSPSNGNTYAGSETQTTYLALPGAGTYGQQQQQQRSPSQSPRSVPPSPTTSGLIGSYRNTPEPISPTPHQHYFDLPVGTTQGQSGRAPTPMDGPISRTTSPQPLANDSQNFDRYDLHKSLKALEGLLVNLDEYRDLAIRVAKVQKKLAKSTSELEKIKVVREAPSQALQVSSAMFETLHQVSSKHAKQVQKEYEAVNDSCAKYFKKVAKEERAHEELMEALDAKIKKANSAHEKIIKKAVANKAIESHDRYIAAVQQLTNDVSRAKNSHAASMGAKSDVSSLLIASTIGGLADLEFRRTCESVKRLGPNVGRLNELLCYTSSESMPGLHTQGLDESETGKAEQFAIAAAKAESQLQAQAQADAQMNKEAQAMLLAQQLGWKPPAAPLSTQNALDRVTSFSSTDRSVSGTSQSNGLQNHDVVNGVSTDTKPQNVCSVRSVATDRTPRQHEQPIDQNVNGRPHLLGSLAQPATEESTDDAPATLRYNASGKHSSILQDQADMITSDTGLFSRVSDDRNGLSRSADERESTYSMLGRQQEDFQPAQPKMVDSAISKRPAERALEQYKAASSPPAVPDQTTAAFAEARSKEEISTPSGKVSLWERERERMRQLEKDDNLQRRLAESQRQIRSVHNGDRNSSSGSEGFSRNSSNFYQPSAVSTRSTSGSNQPKSSEREPPVSQRNSSLGLGHPRLPGNGADTDRFAPTVGSSRLSGTGVTRSLSTDTTASERSFVSRMKARYQDQKEIEREQREFNVQDKERERAARRVTIDPSSRRVPELASRYQSPASGSGSLPLTYAQEVPSRRYHDSLPTGNGSSRLSGISSSRTVESIDEFGAYRRGVDQMNADIRRLSPSNGVSAEPIHSDVCGCHECSARHYGNVMRKSEKTGKSLGPRPFNVRRTTMPAPARDESFDSQDSVRITESVSAFYSPTSRYDQLPTPMHGPQVRRSFDDDRRVVFAQEPQSRR